MKAILKAVEKMKWLMKKLTETVGVAGAAAMLALVIPSFSAHAQNLGQLGPSFQTVSNAQTYLNATNTQIWKTNTVAGLTNLIAVSSTNYTPDLFSVWYNPSGTNGAYVRGTNAGFISLGGTRFLSLDVSGIASASTTTNTLLFARTSSSIANASYVDTNNVVTWTFVTPNSGAFTTHTNFQDDADGEWQLYAWYAKTGSGNVTNPIVRWNTAN